MIAVLAAAVLAPLLNVNEVVGKYRLPVKLIDVPPPNELDSAVLLMLRSWKNKSP
jgi:hypothetical protein